MQNKTFRLFISSTFSDLKEERNILQSEVFPEIKSFCKSHGYSFEPIDLRWGVNNEASIDHMAMEICINEVEKVFNYPKPNFLIMLGNRYGWIPVPTEIESKYFNQLYHLLSNDEKRLFDQCYKEDTNCIPNQYILQAIDKIIEQKEVCKQKWEEIEQTILYIILRHQDIFPREMLIGKSATEQEIMKGVLNSAKIIHNEEDNVLCMVRNISNILQIKDKIFLEDDQTKLDDLKLRLKKCSKPNVDYRELTAKLLKKESENKPDKEYLEDYAITVKKYLIGKIGKEIQRLSHSNDVLEEEAHKNFKEERSKIFIGRDKVIKVVDAYVLDENDTPLVIYGESGVGKSALMAKIISTLENKYSGSLQLIYRFVGISEISSQPKLLLDNLVAVLKSNLKQTDNHISTNYSQSVNTFLSILNRFSEVSTNKLVLIIDALDQFETKTSLEWIEKKLPKNIKIIVSTLTSEYGEYYDLLKMKVKPENLHHIEKLNIVDGKKIINSWLTSNNRKLTKVQFDHILSLFEHNGLPLYLKIIFDQALKWKSYDESYKSFDSKTLTESIRVYFENLIKKQHHSDMLVKHTLGYISASKNGLSENELVEILSSDHIVIHDIANPYHSLSSTSYIDKLPAAVWSRLYYDLLRYFTFVEFDDTSLINFYHRKIKECSRDYYYSLSKELYHSNLVEYFWNQPLRYEQSNTVNLRKISELPFHCIKSNSYSKFLDLYSIAFMHEKVQSGQKQTMLNEIFDISINILNDNNFTEDFKNELILVLVTSIMSYLEHMIKDTTSATLSVEDIHATYMFKSDDSFYLRFLEIVTSNKFQNINSIVDSYATAFKARKANVLRRQARLKDASEIYEGLISSGAVESLHNLEQSTIFYDVGTIAYLSANPEGALEFLQRSQRVAGNLNNGISKYMSLVKYGQVRFVYYEEYDLFESILDEAFEIFWKFRLENLSARRFVKNLYALYFELYYAKKNIPKTIEYLSKFENDSISVYKTIFYIPKDPSLFKTTQCTGLTPYEARIKILEGKFGIAADMFKRYLNEFMDEADKNTFDFIAKEYYDYLIALKQCNRLDEFQKEYEIAMLLPDEPLNAIWKQKIVKLRKSIKLN